TAPLRRLGAVAAQALVVAEEGGDVVVAKEHPAAQLGAPQHGRLAAGTLVLRIRVGDRLGGEGIEVHRLILERRWGAACKRRGGALRRLASEGFQRSAISSAHLEWKGPADSPADGGSLTAIPGQGRPHVTARSGSDRGELGGAQRNRERSAW